MANRDRAFAANRGTRRDLMMARIAMMRALHRREPHEAQKPRRSGPRPTGSIDLDQCLGKPLPPPLRLGAE